MSRGQADQVGAGAHGLVAHLRHHDVGAALVEDPLEGEHVTDGALDRPLLRAVVADEVRAVDVPEGGNRVLALDARRLGVPVGTGIERRHPVGEAVRGEALAGENARGAAREGHMADVVALTGDLRAYAPVEVRLNVLERGE